MNIEIPCSDEPKNSAVFNIDEDEGFLSVELELNDGETHMTIMSLADAKELRDFLVDNL